MKPITTRQHGILDYATGVLLLLLPRLFRMSSGATTLMSLGGLSALTYSIVTKYELGLKPLIPMRAHLMLDKVSGVMFILSPLVVPARTATRLLLFSVGVFEVTAAMLTQEHPPRNVFERLRNEVVTPARLLSKIF